MKINPMLIMIMTAVPMLVANKQYKQTWKRKKFAPHFNLNFIHSVIYSLFFIYLFLSRSHTIPAQVQSRSKSPRDPPCPTLPALNFFPSFFLPFLPFLIPPSHWTTAISKVACLFVYVSGPRLLYFLSTKCHFLCIVCPHKKYSFTETTALALSSLLN